MSETDLAPSSWIGCNPNVFGACAHSGLIYIMTDHGNQHDSWIFLQDVALLIISMCVQLSFIFWVWCSIDLRQARESCAVHPIAKLSSVSLLVTSVLGAFRSCILHSRIILGAEKSGCVQENGGIIPASEMKIETSTFRKHIIFAISSISELAILTLYLPLGLMYIILQGSPEDTVMASVALNFILEIDELLFEKFAGQWRIKQIKKISFQVPYTLKDNSNVNDSMDGAPPADESDSNQYELAGKPKKYKYARICENSASKLKSFFLRDLLLAMALTFGVVFGIRNLLLDCPSWRDSSSQTAILNVSTSSNISFTGLTPVQTPASAKGVEFEVCVPAPGPSLPPYDAHFDPADAARTNVQVNKFYVSMMGISALSFAFFLVESLRFFAAAHKRVVHDEELNPTVGTQRVFMSIPCSDG
jgi:hypothetical protein